MNKVQSLTAKSLLPSIPNGTRVNPVFHLACPKVPGNHTYVPSDPLIPWDTNVGLINARVGKDQSLMIEVPQDDGDYLVVQ